MAGRALTVDLRTVTRSTTGSAFAGGAGHQYSGLPDRRGGHRPWSCTSGWARPGKQAGWVAAEAIRTRAGDQSKPPAHQQSGEEQPGQLSFAVLQPERQSVPGLGRGAFHLARPQRESPARPLRAPRSSGKGPPKPPCLHSFTHSLSRYLGTPCRCQDQCWALGIQQ